MATIGDVTHSNSTGAEGPALVGKVKRELAQLLREDGFKSVQEAVGAYHRQGKSDNK